MGKVASIPAFIRTLPIYARSEANCRDHWSIKAKRVKEQRGIAMIVCRAASGVFDLPVVVMLTRIRKQGARLLDDDNCRSALKAVRDGVADALGIDDGDEHIRWEYRQEQGVDYAVRIEIQGAA